MADYYPYPIYARDPKEVPDWMKANWQHAVPVDKLKKDQLKVKMCCLKCEEKVVEEIGEVHGVFSVRAERFNSKVVVVYMPVVNGVNEHEVLRRARKVDKKAKFVELDAKERPKTEEQKKKEAEEKKKKEAEQEMKKKGELLKKEQEAAIANMYIWKPPPVPLHWDGRYYAPAPLHWDERYYAPAPHPDHAYYPGEFFFREHTARLKEEEKKEEEEKKKKKKEHEAAASIPGFMWYPNGAHFGGPSYAPPQPYPYYPEELRELRPSQWYSSRSFYPPPSFQQERDEFSRPYYLY